jgi:aryl-alcohol dehydrogenase-like predicted oxidoreductase
LKSEGKIHHYGITGLGETSAVLRVIDAGTIETAQTVFNLLNPSAGRPVPSAFYAQDFGQLISHAANHGVGVIVIRVLAAGALSGGEAHPLAGRGGPPMGTSSEFSEDVAKAERFRFLVDEGLVGDPVEGALRFALASDDVSTVLVGFSDLDQIDPAVACAEKGPLPPQAVDRLPSVWDTFVSGEE